MGLVLIADDNPHAHRMGRQILSQEGHDVVTVSSGDEAMDYLDDNRPDLVMADTRMPGPSGYEVCRRVKQDEGDLAGVKVVLLAGPLEPFDSDQAQECGSDAVLHKPLDAFTLIDTVNSLIGKPDPSSAGEHEAVQGAEEPGDEGISEPEEPPAPPEDLDEIRSEETWGSQEAPATQEDLDRARETVEALKAVAPAATAATAVVEPKVEEQAEGEASDDPFADIVREALAPAQTEAERREKVRAAVAEVLEAAMPTLIDTITEHVWANVKEE